MSVELCGVVTMSGAFLAEKRQRNFLPTISRVATLAIALTVALLAAFLRPAPAAAQCIGTSNVRLYFEPGSEIFDIVGLRYKFNVAINTQPALSANKILFGGMRFYGAGGIETYLLESNLYARGLSYTEDPGPVCTVWPLQGTLIDSEASLRVAVPDYNEHGKTGAKTFDPIVFPRQSYKIDNGPIDKTDMISQLNLNGITTEVEITRGSLVTDKTGWKCSGDLDASTYQQWDVTVAIGATQYALAFALPLDNAAYFSPNEVINYITEFFEFPGNFQVFVWDHEVMREATGTWQPVEQWIVDYHCLDLSKLGARVSTFAGSRAIEISNVGADDYLQAGSVFSIGTFRDITIDFKPGNKQNVIFPNEKGEARVAILGNTDFDVTLVDPLTMRLGPDEASPDKFRFKDVDGNGYMDLLARFKAPEIGISCGDTEVHLTAETFDGQILRGSDSIKTVDCQAELGMQK